MKIVPIRSRMLFGDFYPRPAEGVSEGVKFSTGVALTICAPTLLLCYVVGHYLPLYVMACDGTLGAIFGVWMFGKPRHGFDSCVPADNISDDPGVTHARRIA